MAALAGYCGPMDVAACVGVRFAELQFGVRTAQLPGRSQCIRRKLASTVAWVSSGPEQNRGMTTAVAERILVMLAAPASPMLPHNPDAKESR